jgi:hypothetical protein
MLNGEIAMTEQRTRVDFISLEDFHRTLSARLAEVDTVLRKLDNELADANDQASRYTVLQMQHGTRARRLHAALTAAQTATATIIANYSTTEARNDANAAAIASVLGGVAAALKEGDTNDVF